MRISDFAVKFLEAPALLQLERRRVYEIVRQLSFKKNACVLDVGCGTGLTTVKLAQLGYTVEAVDLSAKMIDLTRHRIAEARVSEQVSLCVGNVYTLQFVDNTFDLVLEIGMLEWLQSPRKAIEELVRVAKPGSYIIFTSANYWRLNRVLDPLLSPLLLAPRHFVKRVLASFGSKISNNKAESEGMPYLRPLNDVVTAAGSEVELIKVVSVGFGPFSIFGKRILLNSSGIWLQEKLQRLADLNVPVIRSTGRLHILLAKKRTV